MNSNSSALGSNRSSLEKSRSSSSRDESYSDRSSIGDQSNSNCSRSSRRGQNKSRASLNAHRNREVNIVIDKATDSSVRSRIPGKELLSNLSISNSSSEEERMKNNSRKSLGFSRITEKEEEYMTSKNSFKGFENFIKQKGNTKSSNNLP